MSPRDFALHELDARRLPGWPQELRAAPRSNPRGNNTRPGPHRDFRPPTDPRDLALAEQITVGVIKNLLLLRHLLQIHSGRSLKSIDPLVQKILAIGMYQMRFLTRIPASAAVDEAVEQTKRFGYGRASGFVNAVLRKAAANPEAPLPVRENAAEYATVVLSHPPDLFARLTRLLGPTDALRFCEHDQLEPPTIIRLAPGVTDTSLQAAAQRPVEAPSSSQPTVSLLPHRVPSLRVVTGARRVVLAHWAHLGLAQVQDPTAAAVTGFAKLEPGQIVLDRCCGLGTKTTQMHQAVGDTGRVVAIDPAEARCAALRDLLNHRGISNVDVHCTAWLRELADRPDIPREYDRAIVDVPCSNSGVLARRPEARFHQSERSLESVAQLQDKILEDTAPHIRMDGLLIYSTCSIWPEENQDRILAFVQRHPEFHVEHVQTTLPSFGDDAAQYHDGGYVAVLRRKDG